MAIHGVEPHKQGGRVPPKKATKGVSSSAASKTIEHMQSKLEEAEAEIKILKEIPKNDTELTERLGVYKDFVEQYGTIVESGREDIISFAKELDIVVKNNSADRDLLSAIFKLMFEKMF
jgi:hypothetical protein